MDNLPNLAIQGQSVGVLEPNLAIPARYCLYARKSTEQDELQALSIDSQIKEMLELASKEGLYVTEIRRESHSAKDSGQRPVFSQLLQDIRQGQFNAILCWAPDRLSRNAGDLGSVVDLMDQGLIKEIRTHGQKFTNNPNEKFLLMILGSQAKLENDHKGENVKRGLRAKCEQGWRPGRPPLGYIHDKFAEKGSRKVLIDPLRAPIIKEMFKKVGIEQWSNRKVYQWLKEEAHLTTRNNKRVSISMVELMIKEPFYYGEFEYPVGSGKWYKGGHEPIISKELFTQANQFRKRFHIINRKSKEFAFTRIMKCGHCGSGITADEKFKKLKDGSVNRYVYYGCTKSKDIHCKSKYTREEDLVDQLVGIIDKLDISEIGIKKRFDEEVNRYYKFSKGILGSNGVDYNKQKDIDLRNYAKYVLREGAITEKREVLGCLKSELVLRDGKLVVE